MKLILDSFNRSIHLLVFWILFENVMSLHRSKAAIIGLLEANRVNEWVVTEKLGNTMKQKYIVKASKKPKSRMGERYKSKQIFKFHFIVLPYHKGASETIPSIFFQQSNSIIFFVGYKYWSLWWACTCYTAPYITYYLGRIIFSSIFCYRQELSL